MRFDEAGRRLGSSLRPLLVHKVRTILALSGVAVGVAAVVVSSAIGRGAQQEMVRTIERMGTNLLIVKPLPVKRLVARQAVSGLATTLRIEDYEAIAGLALVAAAAPGVEGNARVKVGTIAMMTTVRGTTPVFPSVRRFQIAAGRFFDMEDVRRSRRVAVLGARVTDALFEGQQPVGQEIRIRGVPFDIIGVLQAKGTTTDGADEDNQILVPIRTALRRIFNTTWLTTVYVSVREPARMNDAETDIQDLLRARHQRGLDSRTDDFAVQNTAKIRSVQQEMTESLSLFAAGLAAIALLVGGIGILALMLLSVRERTSEIGLRMAVGAQPRDILAQFLVEASALALAGWTSGIVLGGAAALAVALGTTWTVGVPVTAVLASFGMAVIIGLGFGALPARSAAQIPPIQALLRT
ncbi:MAG: FtsX-like permease family protein [Luteitalea sp.]|nr:FtsX-like permease family protein [Luteitalea sp.]